MKFVGRVKLDDRIVGRHRAAGALMTVGHTALTEASVDLATCQPMTLLGRVVPVVTQLYESGSGPVLTSSLAQFGSCSVLSVHPKARVGAEHLSQQSRFEREKGAMLNRSVERNLYPVNSVLYRLTKTIG